MDQEERLDRIATILEDVHDLLDGLDPENLDVNREEAIGCIAEALAAAHDDLSSFDQETLEEIADKQTKQMLLPHLLAALRDARDYMSGIAETAAGGDDEAVRLTYRIDRLLKLANP